MHTRIASFCLLFLLTRCQRSSSVESAHSQATAATPAASAHTAGKTSSPFRVGNDVVAPVVLERVAPTLPHRLSRTGPLLFSAIVGKDGRAHDIKIVADGTSPRVGPAYAKALESWRFRPGMLKGQPVETVFHLSINIDVK